MCTLHYGTAVTMVAASAEQRCSSLSVTNVCLQLLQPATNNDPPVKRIRRYRWLLPTYLTGKQSHRYLRPRSTDYTVSREKRATSFSTVTLAFLQQSLRFFYQWK